MNTPLSNKPKITQQDILNGIVKRYFVRHISTGAVTEIDNAQYTKFVKNPMYQTLVIDWNISGFANDTQAANGTTLYGTIHRNTKLVQYHEKKMPGISRILRNPLEYFFGVFNTPAQIFTPLAETQSPVIIVPVQPVPEVVLSTLVSSLSAVNFIVTQSSSVPNTTLFITELDGKFVDGLTYSISGSSLASASLVYTSTPTTMSVAVTSSLIPTGSYTSNIVVSSNNANLSGNLTIPVSMSVVQFRYEPIFQDSYKMNTSTTSNLDVYAAYTYGGGTGRWVVRDFNLINITSNISNNVARLSRHIPMDRTRIEATFFKYAAAATNDAGFAIGIQTGSTDVDFIRVNHVGSYMTIRYVSSSGAESSLASSPNGSAPLNLSTGFNCRVDILDGVISVFSQSVFLVSASLPPQLIPYLTDTSRTIGFHSYSTNQAGAIAFGNLSASRLELQPYTASVPVWNNTVMHLDAANTASYPGSGTLWYDLTGFGNSGSASGVVFASGSSDASGSFIYSGPDLFTLPVRYSLKPELPITYTTWIKTPAFTNSQGLFKNDTGLGTSAYRGVWINIGTSGEVGINYGSGGAPAPGSRRTGTGPSGSISANTWTNVTCVIRGATDMSLYINGVSQSLSYSGTGTGLAYSATDAGHLGWTGANGNFYFTGSMGMASLFAAELSVSEIETYFNRTRQRFGV